MLVTRGEPLKFLPKAFAPKDQIDVLTDQLLTASKEYQQLLEQSGVPSASNTPPTFTSPIPSSPAPTPVQVPPSSCDGMGDVNLDGKIDIADAQVVLRIDAGYIKPTAEQTKRADVNGDGSVNSTDSLIIQRYDAGFIKTFPACSKPAAVKAATTSKEVEDKLNNMKAIAIQRKELLLKKMKENPQEFLEKATLADKTDQFPDEVKPYVEQKFTASGQLEVIHSDNFDNKKSYFDYFLQEGTELEYKNAHKLYFIKNPPQVLSGSKVQASGIQLGNQVVVIPLEFKILEQAGIALQQQETAVLFINFTDNPNKKPFKAEEVRNFLFNASNPKSVNTYYRDNSTNRININGNTHGYYTIEVGQSCDESWMWADRANEAFAKDVGKPIFTEYSRVIYLLPDDRCFPGIAGMGTIGSVKGLSQTWIMGSLGEYNAGVYEHEIGHNLGVHHANKYDCAVGTYTGCSEEEYEDIYDVMGYFWWTTAPLHFNAPHKIALGLLGEGEVQAVTKNNIYTIRALEDPNPGIKVLKIKKPDTDEYYFVSYRQNESANLFGPNSAQFPTELINGASIHIWDEDPARQTKYITAIYNNSSDLALADGKTFYDKINGVSIKQMSHAVSKEQLRGSVNLGVEFIPVPIPSPRPASDQRVFVTSTDYTGKMGGPSGADIKCQSSADAANLGGVWKAWISGDKTSAASRLTNYNTPYKLLDGRVVASNWSDLTDGSLQRAISITEYGTAKTAPGGGGGGGGGGRDVWTGSKANGSIEDSNGLCNNWSSKDSSLTGTIGNTGSTSSWWSFSGFHICAFRAALYCFEETTATFSCTACGADINQDGGVDVGDYSFLVSCFNKKATDKNSNGQSCAPADINGDGIVDVTDSACVNSKFGQKCTK